MRGGVTVVPFQINVVDNQSATEIQLPDDRDLLTHHFWGAQIIVEDPDGDQGTYSLLSGPVGMYVNQWGNIGWTPSENQIGDFDVIVQFDDNYGAVIEGQFTLNVQSNNPPYFTTTPNGIAYVDEFYRYDAITVDPDNDQRIHRLISGQKQKMRKTKMTY